MGWTSLFLNTNDKKVFILGSGEVAHRRANKFLDNGSKVVLVGSKISKELIEKGATLEKDDSNQNLEKLVDWSDIVVIASGDHELNEYVSSISSKKLLNRADYPKEGNLIVPTSFYIDDVQISIFTNGKSPLMARELRKKIQEVITNEDLLQIKLQDHARNILKEKFDNQKDRKKCLYKILKNNDVNNLLKIKKLEEAKRLAEDIIDKGDSY